MATNREFKAFQEERAKKQYREKAEELYKQITTFYDSLKKFPAELESLRILEREIAKEHTFVGKEKSSNKCDLLLISLNKAFQAAESADKILSNEEKNIIFTNEIHPQLAEAKQLIEFILNKKKELDQLKEFYQSFYEEQIKSIVVIKKLFPALKTLFNEIEQFRTKDFYNHFNDLKFIKDISSEFNIKIEAIKNALATLNIPNKRNLLEKLNFAQEQFTLLPKSLSELTKNYDRNIILPASDAIWNVKYACEILVVQSYGNFPSQIKHYHSQTDINTLNKDILTVIYSKLALQDVLKTRGISLKFKNSIDTMLTLEKFIVIVNLLPSYDAMEFIEYYKKTPYYQNLLKKIANNEKLLPVETICLVLTIDDIHRLKSADLFDAISKLEKKLQKELLVNLNLTAGVIKLEEISKEKAVDSNDYLRIVNDSVHFKKNLEELFARRKNTHYINLQGGHLEKLSIKNMIGFNFTNAILNQSILKTFFYYVGKLIMETPDYSDKTIIRELDQLEKQINSRKNPEEQRLLRIILIRNCLDFLKAYLKKIKPSLDKKNGECLLAITNSIMTHSICQPTKEEKMNNYSIKVGNLYVHKKDELSDLVKFKQELEKMIQSIPSTPHPE